MISSIISNRTSWISAKGQSSDIVLSTRVRLARNIFPFPFPFFSPAATLEKVEELINQAINKLPCFENVLELKLESLSDLEKQLLMEEHFISKEYLDSDVKVIHYCPKDGFSLIINEEDHLRMQVIEGGLELLSAFRTVQEKDRYLATMLNYSYHPRYGFLTTCPTNVGTGMRASAMVHLPGLYLNGELSSALETANKLGIVCRGAYGEGSESTGHLFQVSNQRTIGLREVEIIALIGFITQALINLEKRARESIWKNQQSKLQDKIWRAFGILKYCREISVDEALDHLSFVRLGISMGIITNISLMEINQLIVEVQSGHVMMEQNYIPQSDEDSYSTRAKIISTRLMDK